MEQKQINDRIDDVVDNAGGWWIVWFARCAT
jgi:hypothetical protein